MEPVPLTSLRLLVEHEGVIRKVAKVAFAKNDTSLYVMPYQREGGQGFAGQMMVPAPGESNSLNFKRQLSGKPVKVSIHESGRTHAQAGALITEPAWGRGLFHEDKSHIATIICYSPVGLPVVEELRQAPAIDFVITGEGRAWTSIHVPLWVCPDVETASVHHAFITVTRPDRPRPLYIAIGGRLQYAPEQENGEGTVVLAGWGPGNDARPLNGIFAVAAPAETQLQTLRTVVAF